MLLKTQQSLTSTLSKNNIHNQSGAITQSPMLLRASAWFNALVAFFEFLILFLNLHFAKWRLMGQWRMHVSRHVGRKDRHNMLVDHCFCHSTHIQWLQYSVNTEFWRPHNAWEFYKTQSEQKVNVLHLWLHKQSMPALRGHTFYENQNWLQMQTVGNGILRDMNNQRILPYAFIFVYFPMLAKHLYRTGQYGRKKTKSNL